MARRKHKSPPFVAIQRDLLKDPDWRKLASSAKVLYIYLRSKFNHKTLSEVTLAYSEITDMFSPATISKAFKELSKDGWIKKHKQGGLHGGLCTYKFNGKYKEFYYKGAKV